MPRQAALTTDYEVLSALMTRAYTHPSSQLQLPTWYFPPMKSTRVKMARMGLMITNCSVPCLHFRRKNPSTGIGFMQHVISAHDGCRTLPSHLTTTAPGPPMYAMHSDMKL